MKNKLKIIIVTAVIILVGLLIYKSNTQKLSQGIKANLIDVKMKEATINTMMLIYRRGYGEKGVTPFEDNSSYMALVTNLLSQLKTTTGIEAVASIKTSDHSFVVKLMKNGAQEFYCGDSLHEQSGIIVVPVSGNNFTSKTDCNGDQLK